MGFTRLGKQLTQAIVNDVLDALELQNAMQHGRGVLYGLGLSDGGGFDLDVSAGKILGQKPTSLGATTHTLSASQTRYIWIDESGAITSTATLSDPGGSNVCLGRVTTDGSGITEISDEGRVSLLRWSDLWTLTLGEGLITFDLLAKTLAIGGALQQSVNTETLTADKAGLASDASVQVLTPSGAHRKYILPDAVMGVAREVHNGATAGAFDIVIRDPSDSSTIATLSNGQRAKLEPRIGGSYGATAVWPTSVTPD